MVDYGIARAKYLDVFVENIKVGGFRSAKPEVEQEGACRPISGGSQQALRQIGHGRTFVSQRVLKVGPPVGGPAVFIDFPVHTSSP
jgi:hypothetical protein